MKFRLRPVADARHQCYSRDQTWSQLWSQNGMVAGVSVLPTLLAKFNGRETESWELSDNKQQTGLKSLKTQAPSGGLFGIDQEVVTLRGLYGNSGIPDRPASGGSNPYSPVVCGL